MSALFRTSPTPLPTLARLAVGLILFPHGAQHVLGWFGGYGFRGTLGWMTGTLGFPAFLAVLALVTEITAPVALVLGLGGRLAALGVIGLMLGAASTHLANGFFMNWFGALPAGSEGFEYHLIGGHFTGSMLRHIFEALTANAGLTVHLLVLAGRDPHHIAEAEFKAFARAFRQAKALDPLVTGIPSTKGAL